MHPLGDRSSYAIIGLAIAAHQLNFGREGVEVQFVVKPKKPAR